MNCLESVIFCQERMINALDNRDVEALEAVTAELEAAISSLRAVGAVHECEGSNLDYALRQSNAARIRVNVLADWTRQRIDQVSDIRSPGFLTYGKTKIF